MSVYYNEFDPFAVAWLGELMKAGLIPAGDIDTRDIREVEPDDVKDYTQCHFFAGIGGWAYALRLAGWPDDRPVWTGSPPCQPFSVAGRGRGKADERHLAPVWLKLIEECRPPVIFGEQVAAATSKDEWLDDLQDELEAQGYATGAVVLPACGVGAPHIRQRLWFVAERVADSSCERRRGGCEKLVGSDESRQEPEAKTAGHSADGRMADTHSQGLERRESAEECICKQPVGTTGLDNHWANAEWLYCRDGKLRPAPLEPSLFPLADGVSNRVGLLRGAGNAIVPQVAAEIIKTFMEYRP